MNGCKIAVAALWCVAGLAGSAMGVNVSTLEFRGVLDGGDFGAFGFRGQPVPGAAFGDRFSGVVTFDADAVPLPNSPQFGGEYTNAVLSMTTTIHTASGDVVVVSDLFTGFYSYFEPFFNSNLDISLYTQVFNDEPNPNDPMLVSDYLSLSHASTASQVFMDLRLIADTQNPFSSTAIPTGPHGTGDFTTRSFSIQKDFLNSGFGTIDFVRIVPSPGAIPVLALGLAAVARRRR